MILQRIKTLEEQITQYMHKHQDRPYYQEYLRTKMFGYKKIASRFIGENVLELGSDGAATSSCLVRWSKKLTIVDRVNNFNELAQADPLLQKANFILCEWEEFQPKEKFSDIILTDSLEHVDNPIQILSLIKSWLHKDGSLHIIVPNALSLHRLIGVEMGLLETPYHFNQNDIAASHLRVYDTLSLRHDILESGLKISSIEGVQLKPLTDTKLADMDIEYKNALDALSSYFNDNCAEIYACCTP